MSALLLEHERHTGHSKGVAGGPMDMPDLDFCVEVSDVLVSILLEDVLFKISVLQTSHRPIGQAWPG